MSPSTSSSTIDRNSTSCSSPVPAESWTGSEDKFFDVEISPYLRGSRWFHRLVAAILLIPALPIIGFLVLLVRLTSRGPGLYRQTRVGIHGLIYTMYKIRTMRIDAECDGPQWTRVNDPRITIIGRLLRRSHLDELPQLINVLRGEMTLMGPRPERPKLIHVLAKSIPGYLDRLAVTPGITGLAQINLPPDSDLDSVRRKLRLDLQYIRTATLWMEIRIFIWTGLRLLGIPNWFATRALSLGYPVPTVHDGMSAGSDQPLTAEFIANMHVGRRNGQKVEAINGTKFGSGAVTQTSLP